MQVALTTEGQIGDDVRYLDSQGPDPAMTGLTVLQLTIRWHACCRQHWKEHLLSYLYLHVLPPSLLAYHLHFAPCPEI